MNNQTWIDIFFEGGIIMYCMLGLSIMGGAFFISCLIMLRERILIPTPLVQLVEAVRPEDCAAAAERCERERGPFAVMLARTFSHRNASHEQVEALLDRLAIKAESVLTLGVSGLEVIGAIAPMMGLLGTVLGMYQVFMRIASVGAAEMHLLSAGIAEALITTIAGLTVGIPAFIAASFFARRADRLLVNMETIALELDMRLRAT